MGREAECTVRVGRKTSAGRAQLEGETLSFQGDFRLEIPFERIRDVTVDGDALVVAADDEARFEIGAPLAERWLRLIKQPKGLFDKLELGLGARVAVVDVTDSLFVSALRERAASVAEGRVPEGAPVIFFGAETREALRKVPLLRARMGDTGVLWIVRPKTSPSISQDNVLDALRDGGLYEAKVVPFSRTHTAHKCIVPVELRGQGRRRPPILTIPPSEPLLAMTRGTAGSGSSSKSKKADNLRRSARPAPKKAGTKAKKRR